MTLEEGGGGVRQNETHTFLLLKTLFLIRKDVKIFVSGQDNASKDTFLLFHLIFRDNLDLQISDLNDTRGGSEKRQKKCHVLFEWLLTLFV